MMHLRWQWGQPCQTGLRSGRHAYAMQMQPQSKLHIPLQNSFCNQKRNCHPTCKCQSSSQFSSKFPWTSWLVFSPNDTPALQSCLESCSWALAASGSASTSKSNFTAPPRRLPSASAKMRLLNLRSTRVQRQGVEWKIKHHGNIVP